LELIAIRPLFIFPFTLLGAAGAVELILEYDYADDFTAEDYPTPGSRPTESGDRAELSSASPEPYLLRMDSGVSVGERWR
jgi:hypothetical protein